MILSRPGDVLFFNDLTADIISLSVIGRLSSLLFSMSGVRLKFCDSLVSSLCVH